MSKDNTFFKKEDALDDFTGSMEDLRRQVEALLSEIDGFLRERRLELDRVRDNDANEENRPEF